MRNLRSKEVVILLAAGALGVMLSFGLSVSARAEPLGLRAQGEQTAAVTPQTPFNPNENTLPRPKKGNSTYTLTHEPNSPPVMVEQGYTRAATLFPTFCHEWEQKLHDRELSNRAHIRWHTRDGYMVGNYVGCSPVQSCQCKESPSGLPIGKLTYQESNNYISGKTVNEARHATPKLMHLTNTLEIFSWDRGRWFY